MIACSVTPASTALRAIVPTWSCDAASLKTPCRLTRPQLGLNPINRLSAGGKQMQPPVSVPSEAQPGRGSHAGATARHAGPVSGIPGVLGRSDRRMVVRLGPFGQTQCCGRSRTAPYAGNVVDPWAGIGNHCQHWVPEVMVWLSPMSACGSDMSWRQHPRRLLVARRGTTHPDHGTKRTGAISSPFKKLRVSARKSLHAYFRAITGPGVCIARCVPRFSTTAFRKFLLVPHLFAFLRVRTLALKKIPCDF